MNRKKRKRGGISKENINKIKMKRRGIGRGSKRIKPVNKKIEQKIE